MTLATFETSKGVIEIELFDDAAPNTVKNFVSLIEDGFYDGLTFHRVLDEFVIQGGCPQGSGMGGPGYKIPCETSGPKQVHENGFLSMAHAGLNTGGSQFFIVLNKKNCTHLDRKHTVFGQTISGFQEVARKIQQGDKILKATVKDVSDKIRNWELKKV
ncbi:MAG: peptidylprolyl isomerase [Candidatus Heimdallarchaeota archaeon]|nr:peptidylprolyl isomerase [Candidatus Heimdallarchaeota archaeon]MBY8994178.1 peptidylprolyl isomerase [Candidatus Heimdallarchaeota archaeon]